jgi:hypothetical protein
MERELVGMACDPASPLRLKKSHVQRESESQQRSTLVGEQTADIRRVRECIRGEHRHIRTRE